MAEFYGIDLGTTYSCIARINSDDIVEIIQIKGEQYIPSVVSFDNSGKMLVGKAAKNNITNNEKNTVMFIKRKMDDTEYKRTINGKTYDPVDISSFILKELVDEANKKLANEEGLPPIYDVVITVPAYFGTIQKERTKAAGQKAGLNVLQLIQEPTAAALSYGKKQRGNKTLLVYDLGGGTFDVSILRFQNCVVDTLATAGDHHLGGADWDRAIIDYVLGKIGTTFDALSPEDQGMMMIAAEEAKKTLTSTDSTTITFPSKGGIHNVEITRQEFESQTAHLLNSTMIMVDQALDLANKTISDIDEVILVGGSCYMPMVKIAVDEKFGQSSKLVDPNLAVAKGAALTASQNQKGYVEGGVSIGMDKGSRAYGMRSYNPNLKKYVICTLINRNDDLIVNHEEKFVTKDDGQTGLGFKFYEYECDEKELNINDEWELKGREDGIEWGYPVPKGTPIKIIASRDKNGIVKVFAECEGAKGEFVIVTGA